MKLETKLMLQAALSWRRFSLALVALLVCVWPREMPAQDTDEFIDSLIAKVELDSLMSYLRTLTGEDSVWVGDSVMVFRPDSLGRPVGTWYSNRMVALTRRVEMGNEIAAYWIHNKLRSFGYGQVDKEPLDDSRPWMQNVIATKTGSVDPTRTFILCAHYDAVPPAPGADDNASGTAAVLEAARILAEVQTDYTILFALWDSEEIGLVGSEIFAAMAYDDYPNLDRVLNLDMIAWDGDDDRTVEIHTDSQSLSMAEDVQRILRQHELELNPVIIYPGTGRSDNASFWRFGYPSVLLIEELTGGDFNPFYHSRNDDITSLDRGYLLEISKLALATIARHALGAVVVSAEPPEFTPIPELRSVNYPNPFGGLTRITVELSARGPLRLSVFDVMGRLVDQTSYYLPASNRGQQVITWRPADTLPRGVYFYIVESSRGSASGSMTLVR
jgi:hypothetical protein